MRLLAAVLAIGGCTRTSSPTTRVPLDRSAAVDLINEIGSLTTAMKAMDSIDGQGAAGTMFIDALSLFPPIGNTAGPRTPMRPAGATVSATCSPSSCKVAVSFDDQMGTTYSELDTISLNGDVLTVDDHAGYQKLYEVANAWTLGATLTLGGGHVDGTFTPTQSFGGHGAPVMIDSSIDVRAVELDASGCPVGGSLYATVSSMLVDDDGLVTFGPLCGISQ